MADKINLFISHYGGDEKYVEKVKKIISNGYDVRDSSLVETEPNNAKNEDYIKSILRTQINWAGKIIVLIGPKTHEREWVNWEINYAAKHGEKQIIGVFLPGATDSDLPDALENFGDSCVAWNENKIISAIEGEIIWEDSTGATKTELGDRSVC